MRRNYIYTAHWSIELNSLFPNLNLEYNDALCRFCIILEMKKKGEVKDVEEKQNERNYFELGNYLEYLCAVCNGIMYSSLETYR